MNWQLVTTGVVGAYGAALATHTAVVRHLEKTRRYRVTLEYAYFAGPMGIGPPNLSIVAANVGDRLVCLTMVGLLLPDGRQVVVMQPQTQLPFELTQGRSVNEYMPLVQACAQARDAGYSGNVKIRGFWNDALGTKHVSRPKTIQA